METVAGAEPSEAERTACGLVALLGWDWWDGLNSLKEEPDEVLVEYIRILMTPLKPGGPNPFQVDPEPPASFKESDASQRPWTEEEQAWRFDLLARKGITEAMQIMRSRKQRTVDKAGIEPATS